MNHVNSRHHRLYKAYNVTILLKRYPGFSSHPSQLCVMEIYAANIYSVKNIVFINIDQLICSPDPNLSFLGM